MTARYISEVKRLNKYCKLLIIIGNSTKSAGNRTAVDSLQNIPALVECTAIDLTDTLTSVHATYGNFLMICPTIKRICV